MFNRDKVKLKILCELLPNKGSVYTPFNGNGTYIISEIYQEGEEVEKNKFNTLRKVSDLFDVNFEKLKEIDELFDLKEDEISQEIVWYYQCNIELFLDFIMPLIRETKLKELLDGRRSSHN